LIAAAQFCYMRLMRSSGDFTGPVNLGIPGEFTIKELAENEIGLIRIQLKALLPTIAARRSQTAATRHQPRQGEARSEAEGAARRGAPVDDFLFRQAAGGIRR